jgi:8-oxo-dGTP pyrophosphatase MutT (NUDIX family)
MTTTLRTRKTARAIVLNDFGEILLIKHLDTTPANPNNPDILTYWVAPGGGVENHETYEQAAKRELAEETGIVVDKIENCLHTWSGELVSAGELVRQDEQFFLSKVSGRPDIPFFDSSEGIVDARWWPIAEIENSSEIFFPTGLASLMKDVLKQNIK